MNTTLTLGQTIKVFRKHKGISQLDLELKIIAAAGSISRMENDRINPTKETLAKISEALELTQYETGLLYKSPVKSSNSLYILKTNLNHTVDINTNKLKQLLVSELLYQINKSNNYITSLFFKVSNTTENLQLQLYSISNSLFYDIFATRLKVENAYISFNPPHNTDNLLSQVTQTNQPAYHPNISNFLTPPFTLSTTQLIQKLLNINSMGAIPLFNKHNKLLGIVAIALGTSLGKLSKRNKQTLEEVGSILSREIDKILGMKLNE